MTKDTDQNGRHDDGASEEEAVLAALRQPIVDFRLMPDKVSNDTSSICVLETERKANDRQFPTGILARSDRSGQETLTFKGHTLPVQSVAFSPDGKRIVSGSIDKTLKVWDASSGQETLTLKGHAYSVESVASAPTGNESSAEARTERSRYGMPPAAINCSHSKDTPIP